MNLRERALDWLAQDPDPVTRAELQELLDDPQALEDRFGAKLEFGTAGLRGELGAGPNRMNRVTVMRAAAGLAAVLGPGRHVVIGYDARDNSDVFARDSAAVLTGAGLRASLLPRPLPTPVLAFAVQHLTADAGIVVTASHNPPRDNGYKVYWGDGAQIVPPIDERISAAIDAAGSVAGLPLGDDWAVLADDIVDAYLDAVVRLPLGSARELTVAYTPLHGVGGATLVEAFKRAGFAAPAVVPEQFEPDPRFPTVAFPNPEEPGAMDLALALGTSTGADIVIANDPDADRCAVGIPGHGMLTGDQVGGLLAEQVIRNTERPDRLVVTTIVSSSLLSKIAKSYGVRYAESLTGFKWIMKAGEGTLVFGYEEALGYSVGNDDGPPVHDKDGIGAALTVAGLAASAKAEGKTLLDLLEDQARRFGRHATSQLSVRVAELSDLATMMAGLRAEPPTSLGGRDVLSADDLAVGDGGLPPTDGLRYRLAGDARVVVRPSGTEPKLKAYLEVVIPAGEGNAAAVQGLAAIRDDLASDLGSSYIM